MEVFNSILRTSDIWQEESVEKEKSGMREWRKRRKGKVEEEV